MPAAQLRIQSFRISILWACALLWAAQIAAAATGRSVDIGELGTQASVSLSVGDELRVLLKGNPSTGYGWQISANDSARLAAKDAQSSAAPAANALTGKVGSSVIQALTFTAKSAGSDRLVLVYQRPWEKNVPPARSYTLNVTITELTITEQGSPSVTPSGMLLGTYAGKLPCADCSAILQSISFYAAGPNEYLDTYYVSTSQYQGAPGGEVVMVEAGEWTLNRGSASDPNATVYCMYSTGSDRRTNYQLQGNTLVALDPDLKVIRSSFNLNLTKLP